MELTQPAILSLIDYLYTGCIQASSYITVNLYLLRHGQWAFDILKHGLNGANLMCESEKCVLNA